MRKSIFQWKLLHVYRPNGCSHACARCGFESSACFCQILDIAGWNVQEKKKAKADVLKAAENQLFSP